MFVRASLPSRLRWTVQLWTILLSVTAAVLVAVVGLHALADDTIDTAAAATVASSPSVLMASASGAQDSAAPVPVDAVGAFFADSGDALTCGLLALLCVAALAALVIRVRGRAALALAGTGPMPPVPVHAFYRDRSVFAGLTALSIARI